jgi:RNA polymerase sigma factor (sigma-70 family)
MEPRELFSANLALVDRVIGRVCRKAALYGADAEDFASAVRLALIEDDYRIIRGWEQRSSLATFLAVIVQRMLADERMRTGGRWRPSAEAKRLGEAAVVLERLVLREGRSLDAALPLARAIDPSLTAAAAAAIVAKLPEREPRVRVVELDDVTMETRGGGEPADGRAHDAEVQRASGDASRAVRDVLASQPLEDRMLIRMHFGRGMSIADCSRMLRLPQRPLYRRLESLMQRLRRALTEAGVDAATAAEMIGSAAARLDFGLDSGKNEPASQTPVIDEEPERLGEKT